MKISVVLRVKDEGRTLDQVLNGVRRQPFTGELEFVVVDSGSTDRTLEIARAHNCRIVQIRPEDFSWGYALNFGAEHSTGDIVIFLSGHCVPVDENWLAALLAPLDDPQVAGVYSRHVPIPGVDPFEAIELEYLWFPAGDGRPRESLSFSDASCAIRRTIWDKIKFDETLLLCEDGEWAMRVRKAGGKIIYNPVSMVFHSHPLKLETIYFRWFTRCYSAKQFDRRTRDGQPLYLVYKTLLFSFLDLRYLLREGMWGKVWKIPFYEMVRQGAGYQGARAALRGDPIAKLSSVTMPPYFNRLRSLLES